MSGSRRGAVDTALPPPQPGVTQRSLSEQRLASDACRACHEQFDPLGYGLEPFDAIGRFRDVDASGNPLRSDGELVEPGGASRSYDDVADYMSAIASSERVAHCMTEKFVQFAMGRPLGPDGAGTLVRIREKFEDGGETYRALIRAIVTDPTFRHIAWDELRGGAR